MSLAELSGWCHDRFGKREVVSDGTSRPFDVPWVVLDSSLAGSVWNWQPAISCHEILESIAMHAEQNPDWMQISRRS